jgi:hypothetical protein
MENPAERCEWDIESPTEKPDSVRNEVGACRGLSVTIRAGHMILGMITEFLQEATFSPEISLFVRRETPI